MNSFSIPALQILIPVISLILSFMAFALMPLIAELICTHLKLNPSRKVQIPAAAGITAVSFILYSLSGFLISLGVSLITRNLSLPMNQMMPFLVYTLPRFILNLIILAGYILIYANIQRMNQRETLVLSATAIITQSVFQILQTVVFQYLIPIIRHYNS